MPFLDERIMTTEEQLKGWVAGKPKHNGKDREHGECCPDFSCCYPSLLQPLEVRLAFVNGDRKVKEKFLGVFLAAFAETLNSNVYIAGKDPNDNS